MKQALSEAFVRYGMSVAVTHGEKKTQTKAFLQPVKRENGEEPFSVTPLGAVSDECWRYLGPAEVEIAMGDLVQSGSREYVVRALKEGVVKEDCESAFICAASWLAATTLESARAGGE